MTGDRGIPKLRIAAERTGTSIISLSIGEPPIAMRESDYPILLGIGSSPISKNPSITSVILPPYWTQVFPPRGVEYLGAMAPKLEQAEIGRALRKPTESLDAYDYFLRGMAGIHQCTGRAN